MNEQARLEAGYAAWRHKIRVYVKRRTKQGLTDTAF